VKLKRRHYEIVVILRYMTICANWAKHIYNAVTGKVHS